MEEVVSWFGVAFLITVLVLISDKGNHDQGDLSGGLFAMRYILSTMVFLACFLVYAMRINLSVAIVAMVNSTGHVDTDSDHNGSCKDPNVVINRTEPDHKLNGEFDWNEMEQATITYAFFVGYLLTQIPGGYMAERYSVTWVLGLGIGITSLLTCFTSVVARLNYNAFIFLRVLEGIGEGVAFPSVFAFVARWVAVEEQGVLMNFIISGCCVGTVVTMPLTALLCNSTLGWPAAFYIFGICGVIWSFVWFVVATDGPETNRFISEGEREYILQNRPASAGEKATNVPWRKLLLSPAVLLLGLNKCAITLNFYMIITELPNYLNSVYGINVIDNGFINGGMNLGSTLSVMFSGALADRLIKKKTFSRNFVRKFLTALSTMIPSACLCILPLVGCNYGFVLGLLMANCVFLGLSGGGDAMVSLDLAPKYAGTVQGVVNLMGNVAGVLSPQLVGFLTYGQNTIGQWNKVFILTAISTVVGSLMFLIFASTEEQEWATDKTECEEDDCCTVAFSTETNHVNLPIEKK